MKTVNHLNYFDENNQVYCRLKHSIVNSTDLQCRKCQYFNGVLQGNGVECVWADIYSQPVKNVYDPYQELSRVHSLQSDITDS